MSSKVIIDSKSALNFYNQTHLDGVKMNQKQLSLRADVRVQSLINLQKEATLACELIIKIHEITGAPLSEIVKKVPK